jgi:hypothetical protein
MTGNPTGAEPKPQKKFEKPTSHYESSGRAGVLLIMEPHVIYQGAIREMMSTYTWRNVAADIAVREQRRSL